LKRYIEFEMEEHRVRKDFLDTDIPSVMNRHRTESKHQTMAMVMYKLEQFIEDTK
jgi:hypothetical protein